MPRPIATEAAARPRRAAAVEGESPSRLALKAALDGLYGEYNRVDSAADPVHLVRRYDDPADREVAGFVAAALAFGRVASVLAAIERVLDALGERPAAFVRVFDPARPGRRLRACGHRWTRGADVAALLGVLGAILREAGTIEAFFLRGYDPRAVDCETALESFARRALALAGPVGTRRAGRLPGVAFFFPRPSAGSACKRLNLFLRWMVRRDAIDLGVWSTVSPAQLVVPLDTHVVRVGQCLGLTRVRSPGWRMAAEITAALRQLDPHDPVKYDFALCRLGMSGECHFGREGAATRCRLTGLCRGTRDGAGASRPGRAATARRRRRGPPRS